MLRGRALSLKPRLDDLEQRGAGAEERAWAGPGPNLLEAEALVRRDGLVEALDDLHEPRPERRGELRLFLH